MKTVDFNTPVDYSLAQNWLSQPSEKVTTSQKPVDVFFLYPTTYYKSSKDFNICEVSHKAMRARAQEHIQTKASVFSEHCNLYAPVYRQAAVECITEKTAENENLFTLGPINSILDAFDYYIKNFNNGRPFILAGHSQGSLLLQSILSNYFKQYPHLTKRMVAAYVIGFAITKDFLKKNPHLHFAKNAKDVGVVISYNTEAPHFKGENITLLPNSVAINPISWTLGAQKADASQSRGSRMILRSETGALLGTKDLPHHADATLNLERGAVVCSTVNPEDFKIPGFETEFPLGVMHRGDYELYYYDLQHNVKERIDAYFHKD